MLAARGASTVLLGGWWCPPGLPSPAQTVIVNRSRRLPLVQFVHHHSDHHEPSGKQRFPLNEGLPLSLFHPFKRLPPEGTTLPAEEEMCNPEEELCHTPLHVYEARCTACSGTGWARAPSNGRRGHLGTCMMCHGLGYVRRTTSRFCPDDPDKHMSIARPLTWNGKFAARLTSFSRTASSNGRGTSEGSQSSNEQAGNQGSSSSGGSGERSGGGIGRDIRPGFGASSR